MDQGKKGWPLVLFYRFPNFKIENYSSCTLILKGHDFPTTRQKLQLLSYVCGIGFLRGKILIINQGSSLTQNIIIVVTTPHIIIIISVSHNSYLEIGPALINSNITIS